MECPGFVPDPDNPNEKYAVFSWFKARESGRSASKRVAIYDKSSNRARITGDLQGRASVDGTTGTLKIIETRITDDHYYTCVFFDTAKGIINNETQLIITGKVMSTHYPASIETSNRCLSYVICT